MASVQWWPRIRRVALPVVASLVFVLHCGIVFAAATDPQPPPPPPPTPSPTQPVCTDANSTARIRTGRQTPMFFNISAYCWKLNSSWELPNSLLPGTQSCDLELSTDPEVEATISAVKCSDQATPVEPVAGSSRSIGVSTSIFSASSWCYFLSASRSSNLKLKGVCSRDDSTTAVYELPQFLIRFTDERPICKNETVIVPMNKTGQLREGAIFQLPAQDPELDPLRFLVNNDSQNLTGSLQYCTQAADFSLSGSGAGEESSSICKTWVPFSSLKEMLPLNGFFSYIAGSNPEPESISFVATDNSGMTCEKPGIVTFVKETRHEELTMIPVEPVTMVPGSPKVIRISTTTQETRVDFRLRNTTDSSCATLCRVRSANVLNAAKGFVSNLGCETDRLAVKGGDLVTIRNPPSTDYWNTTFLYLKASNNVNRDRKECRTSFTLVAESGGVTGANGILDQSRSLTVQVIVVPQIVECVSPVLVVPYSESGIIRVSNILNASNAPQVKLVLHPLRDVSFPSNQIIDVAGETTIKYTASGPVPSFKVLASVFGTREFVECFVNISMSPFTIAPDTQQPTTLVPSAAPITDTPAPPTSTSSTGTTAPGSPSPTPTPETAMVPPSTAVPPSPVPSTSQPTLEPSTQAPSTLAPTTTATPTTSTPEPSTTTTTVSPQTPKPHPATAEPVSSTAVPPTPVPSTVEGPSTSDPTQVASSNFPVLAVGLLLLVVGAGYAGREHIKGFIERFRGGGQDRQKVSTVDEDDVERPPREREGNGSSRSHSRASNASHRTTSDDEEEQELDRMPLRQPGGAKLGKSTTPTTEFGRPQAVKSPSPQKSVRPVAGSKHGLGGGMKLKVDDDEPPRASRPPAAHVVPIRPEPVNATRVAQPGPNQSSNGGNAASGWEVDDEEWE